MMEDSLNIVIIGTGNVAYHLGPALRSAGHNIVQVFGRTKSAAAALAQEVSAMPISDITEISATAELYLIMVSDAAIPSILKTLPAVSGVVAHTSGATESGVITDHGFTGGYFYPLQTFVKGEELDLRVTPLFVQANEAAAERLLLTTAQSISTKVSQITDLQKQTLHLAAVIVNNFVNHLFALSSDLLTKEHLNFEHLEPIIQTTIARAVKTHPKQLQTGPAKRHDVETITAHLKMLENQPILKQVYEQMSSSIGIYQSGE